MSRFIHQLLRIYRPHGLTHRVHGYDIRAIDPEDVVVKKTPEIMAAIDQYRTPGSGRSLSASSIRSYIECPLKFYLEHICHLKRQDDIRDWMAESVFGSVVHKVLETAYDEMADNPGRVVTPDALEQMAHNDIALDRHITRAINKEHLKLPDDRLDTPLEGADRINSALIKSMVVATMKADRPNAPLKYLKGEYRLAPGTQLTLTGSVPDDARPPRSVTFNFGGTIDRIDIVNPDTSPRLRIIDYKTGQEASDVKIDELVPDISRTSARFSHAIVQLFFYAQALESDPVFGKMGGIQPMVYPLRTASQRAFAPVKIDGEEITDHHVVTPRINDMILPFIDELFDPAQPLRPACDGNACTYCKFTEICGSKPKKK